MDAESYARALHQALEAEGLLVEDRDGDLSRVRIAGQADLMAVARRMRHAAGRSRRPASPLDEPPAWLRAYP